MLPSLFLPHYHTPVSGTLPMNRTPTLRDLLLLIFRLALVYMFFCTQTFFGTNNYKRLYAVTIGLIFLFAVMLAIHHRGRIRIRKSSCQIYLVLLLPNVGLLLLSLIEFTLNRRGSFGTMLRYSVWPLLTCILALLAYQLFEHRSVRAVLWAALINYSVYVIYCTAQYGILSLFSAGTDSPASHLLEVHEITFVFGLFAFYFFVNRKRNRAHFWILPLLCALLGFKRILCAVFALSFFLYQFLCRKKRAELLYVCSICFVIFSFLWCYFCSNPQWMQKLQTQWHIDLKGRDWIYRNFYPYYTLSPSYFGSGLGFTQWQIGHLPSMYLRGHYIGLHNEILRLYIDLGFVPNLFYLCFLFPFSIRYLRRRTGYRSAFSYFLLLSFTFLCCTTDNLLTYPNYMLCFYLLSSYTLHVCKCRVIHRTPYFTFCLQRSRKKAYKKL